MKRIVFLSLLACWPTLSFGQVVNPTIIYQDTDIALHNTDVYYAPMAPPDSTDTPLGLSCLGSMDSDGITHYYYPKFHGGQLDTFKLCDTCPMVGNATPWQRLFTVMDKPSGAHSDIIAGGAPGDRVIISKNEDVDFRATGIIKLENGFHAMPGCHFHAYTAPKWDTTVFSDEFNDTAKFNNQWLVGNNAHGFDGGADCSYDSNYALVPDSEAEDGWALRLDLKENLDICHCVDVNQDGSLCVLDSGSPPTRDTFLFSTATLGTCPFPFRGDTDPIRPAYHNAPYGKYEVREKVPMVEHHTNNYGSGQGNEWNLGEKTGGGLSQIHVGLTRRFQYGPFQGRFGMLDTTQIFYSSQAHFAFWNKPDLIVINNFPYQVQFKNTYPTDTLLITNATTIHEGGFPSSLVNDSMNPVAFYYTKVGGGNVSDSLAWSVDAATGTHFTGPYADSLDDTLFFRKSYQPTDITLFDNVTGQHILYHCHWDHRDGKILLTDTMSPFASHTGYGFSYDVNEGPDYPVPPINVDTSTYKYHTYTMEFLPHEALFLIDGAVRQRFPDRLIPIGDKRYDYVTTCPRAPMNITSLGEIGIDVSTNPLDPFGTDTTGDWDQMPVSITHQERKYFEWADTILSHGCWPDYPGGPPAAHHMIDYIKIWDLSSDAKLPDFPH